MQHDYEYTNHLEGAGPASTEHDKPFEVPAMRAEASALPPFANGAATDGGDTVTWHAEAGRKGARRIHELIHEGMLYEKEHGLKRGRQRLRQLIELGKLYEKEHGLRPERPRTSKRRPRVSTEKALLNLLRALEQMARPSFRAKLAQMIEILSRDNG